MVFSLCECFCIFLNLCIAVQLGCAHEDILPALGKIRDKQRSDTQMAGGRESDLIDWLQALYIEIAKAHTEEESWFLLGEARFSPPSLLCPCLFTLVALVPFLYFLCWDDVKLVRAVVWPVYIYWPLSLFSNLACCLSLSQLMAFSLAQECQLFLAKIGSIPLAVWWIPNTCWWSSSLGIFPYLPYCT